MAWDRIPPLTSDEVMGFLEDGSFSVYLYVGREDDPGWEVAQIVYGLLPRLRIYLVEDPSTISDLVGVTDSGGIVFGWGREKFKSLSASDAEDLRTVLFAIQASRKAP